MADKNATQEKDNKRLQVGMKDIQKQMDRLYDVTKYGGSELNRTITDMKDSMDTTIDQLPFDSANNTAGLDKVYNALKGDNNPQSSLDIEGALEDRAITDALLFDFSGNKTIKEYDEEIDILCKYMPSLVDALEIKKDNVLSADQYNKDFLIATNTSNVNTDTNIFNDRMKKLKKKYNLLDVMEAAYDNAAMYGEEFIYISPYNKALNKLLGNKVNTAIQHEEGVITESFELSDVLEENGGILGISENNTSIKLEMCTTGQISSVIKEYDNMRLFNKKSKLDGTIKGTADLKGLSSDGLIDAEKQKETGLVETPGCIVKRLPRANVIPVYIEEMCLGYYYIESSGMDLWAGDEIKDPMVSLKTGRLDNSKKQSSTIEQSMKRIAGNMAKSINTQFINNNQDLSQEIYSILKYNDIFNSRESVKLKVTFIPPGDMIHLYFKKDPNTHRGISDLDRALLPAKLYTSLYVTNTIGILTRSQDKRVYYVKQNVDTNISKVMMNTLNQIKKSNFGTREMTSVKNMLNITGRFNDYMIPMGPTGDAPINFEVMQGQDIDPKMDLMESLEQMAINSVDVPYELVQSKQSVDYAVRLTMSNGKFLRYTFKRQAKVETPFSTMVSKIYNAEYAENDYIQISLPTPGFLNLLNSNQIFNNANEYSEQVVDMQLADEEDDRLKMLYKKKVKRHYLATQIDGNAIDNLLQEARIEHAVKYPKTDE